MAYLIIAFWMIHPIEIDLNWFLHTAAFYWGPIYFFEVEQQDF
jgi:hypothetical protein